MKRALDGSGIITKHKTPPMPAMFPEPKADPTAKALDKLADAMQQMKPQAQQDVTPVLAHITRVLDAQSDKLAAISNPVPPAQSVEPRQWHCQINRDKKGLIESLVLTEILE